MSHEPVPPHERCGRECASIPSLDRGAADLREELSRASRVVRLQAGDCLLDEGDRCGHVVMVISGRVRAVKRSRTSGQELAICSIGPGEMCPLHVACLLSSEPAAAMVRAEEPVEAMLIPQGTFWAMVVRDERFRSLVFRTFAARLSETMALVEEIAFETVAERLARRLVQLLSRAEGPRPSVRITHAELAADLGTAREVISRLLKEFEGLGAIALSRGRIELRDGPSMTPRARRHRSGAPASRRGPAPQRHRASRPAIRPGRKQIVAAWSAAWRRGGT